MVDPQQLLTFLLSPACLEPQRPRQRQRQTTNNHTDQQQILLLPSPLSSVEKISPIPTDVSRAHGTRPVQATNQQVVINPEFFPPFFREMRRRESLSGNSYVQTSRWISTIRAIDLHQDAHAQIIVASDSSGHMVHFRYNVLLHCVHAHECVSELETK